MAVTHAVLELAERPVSLCVSGINYGENIGVSIATSGTVGAAPEADVCGIPAIAAAVTTQVSEWRTFGTVDWTAARHFTRLLARQVLAEGVPDGVSALNLNVPQDATPQTELSKSVQSRQRYCVVSRPSAPRPFDQPFELAVEVAVDWDDLGPETDIYAIARDRVASVTPLTWQMTADTDWTPRGPALPRTGISAGSRRWWRRHPRLARGRRIFLCGAAGAGAGVDAGHVTAGGHRQPRGELSDQAEAGDDHLESRGRR
jgi:broad specificity polyphosphatase/5'/3'-nucleotidase SurE